MVDACEEAAGLGPFMLSRALPEVCPIAEVVLGREAVDGARATRDMDALEAAFDDCIGVAGRARLILPGEPSATTKSLSLVDVACNKLTWKCRSDLLRLSSGLSAIAFVRLRSRFC